MSEKVYVVTHINYSYDTCECLGVYRDLKEAAALYCREWVELIRRQDYGSWYFGSQYTATSEEELSKQIYYKAQGCTSKGVELRDWVCFDSVQLQKVTLV